MHSTLLLGDEVIPEAAGPRRNQHGIVVGNVQLDERGGFKSYIDHSQIQVPSHLSHERYAEHDLAEFLASLQFSMRGQVEKAGVL